MSNKIEDKTLLHQLLPSSIADEEIFKNAATALHTNSDTKGHLNDGLFYVCTACTLANRCKS